MTSLIPFMHHEKQEKGSMLCAQHALNSVLQGQYFDPSQLSEIATRLDGLEKDQMEEQQWRQRGKDKSTLNMDDTGYFSLSVLEEALSVWGLTLERWRSAAMKPFQEEPEAQSSFVLTWRTIGSLSGDLVVDRIVVRSLQSEDETPAIFLSTEPDEMALSLGDQIIHSTSNGKSDSKPGLGLKSSSTSFSGNGNRLGGVSSGSNRIGDDEEDEELQAALRASLMDSDPNASGSVNKGKGKEIKSIKPSLGSNSNPNRRNRSEESEDGREIEENDDHVDLIAPSKNRRKGKSNSGGRKSKERSLTLEEEEDDEVGNGDYRLLQLVVVEEEESKKASSSSRSNPIASSSKSNRNQSSSSKIGGGKSREDAIELDDDDEDEDETIQSRSPFLNPALRNQDVGIIDVDGLDDDNDDEDVEEHLDKKNWISFRAHARIGNRYYDDEDAELQAALAASMNDHPNPNPSTSTSNSSSNQNGNGNGGNSGSDGFDFKAWENYKSPPPDDVSKISRMREEARKKEREEKDRLERIKRGELVEEDKEKGEKNKKGNGDDDEEEEEEEEEISPEEIRRRRLARLVLEKNKKLLGRILLFSYHSYRFCSLSARCFSVFLYTRKARFL
ncbi:hypothetical protein L7F22_047987 [Adiantum nelumboides]|nr:hypothetical protein [Adiantum nelumboides]